MDLVNRVYKENKDKKKNWLTIKAVNAISALYQGLNNEESIELQNYLLALSQKMEIDNVLLPSLVKIAPLVFQSKHIFDTDKVKKMIITYDKKAESNQGILETDIYFYSIIFDLYNGKSFDSALNSATQLSEELSALKIDFGALINKKNDALSQDLDYLINCLSSVLSNEFSNNPIVLFLRGLMRTDISMIEYANEKSIKDYVNYCLSL